MNVNGAVLVVKALQQAQVHWVFGIPGTHNIELYDAMLDAGDFRTVLITDEQSSGFMADGVARASGELAALNLVPGAGLTHALSGIAEAFLDQIPLLVLVCGIRKDTGKSYQLHAIDQAAVVRPVCKAVFQPGTHAELFQAVTRACALARQAPCGPAVVEIPAELFLLQGQVEAAALNPPSPEPPVQRPLARLEEITAALNGARSIALYVGLGALGADLAALADRLDAVVFTTISGKGVFPESHPRWAWNTLGRGAPKAIRRIGDDCDLMLAIGCRFGEVATASYGVTPPATLIHVDIDPGVFNRNVQAQLTQEADAAPFVRALLAGDLKARAAGPRLGELREAHQAIRAEQRRPSAREGDPVQPATLFEAVHRLCGPDTVFACDSGNGLFLAMEHLRLDHPRSFLGPVDYSCMGYSVPAAIGAQLAQPGRAVAAFVGDGAFLMTGLELMTAAAYGAGVLFFLLRDGELSQIAQFQRVALGRQTCTTLGGYDALAIARGAGCQALKLDHDADVERTVQEALALARTGRPVLIEVAIDYSRPTSFSQGVIKTNFLRLPWKDRVRMLVRIITRKFQQDRL